MIFTQILKNYLFSSNWSLTNPSYRFAPIFYKRFIADFLLRNLIFLPFTAFFLVLVEQGLFKDIAETMLQSNQNAYGYLLVIFIYIPIALFFLASLIASLVGSILKRNVFKPEFQDGEYSILPLNYKEAFLSAWKNLWYLTVETFIIIFISKICIELYVSHSVTFAFMTLLKSALVTIGTSAILASIVSLPWLKSRKQVIVETSSNDIENQSNDTVIG